MSCFCGITGIWDRGSQPGNLFLIRMFIAALFIIAKNWKQPNVINKRRDKLKYIIIHYKYI